MNNGRKSWWSKMLKHPEWQKMRLDVMERANFKCEKYGCDYPLDETNPLNVHHKYYDEENKWLEPWKYPRGSLQCLCEKHHREVHGLSKQNERNPREKVNILIEDPYNPNAEKYEFVPLELHELPDSILQYNRSKSLWMEATCSTNPHDQGYEECHYSPIEQRVFQCFYRKKNKWRYSVFLEKAVLIKKHALPNWASAKGIKKLLRYPSEDTWKLFGSEYFYEVADYEDFDPDGSGFPDFFNEAGEGSGILDSELTHYSLILDWRREVKDKGDWCNERGKDNVFCSCHDFEEDYDDGYCR